MVRSRPPRTPWDNNENDGEQACSASAFHETHALTRAGGSQESATTFTVLLDAGCHWSEATASPGIHRHTLRCRIEQLRKQTGEHQTTRPSGWSCGSQPCAGSAAGAGALRDEGVNGGRTLEDAEERSDNLTVEL